MRSFPAPIYLPGKFLSHESLGIKSMSSLTFSVQDTITTEDLRFRKFLEENGYDTRTLGNKEGRETISGV